MKQIDVAHVIFGIRISRKDLDDCDHKIPGYTGEILPATIGPFLEHQTIFTEKMCFIGAVVLSGDHPGSYSSRILNPSEINELKKALKQFLEPLGLWNEHAFKHHLSLE